ncbi:hypothetical protein [Sunxiuqinia indica]|uniref:hypothetical protein n=1 Tax=Sunxiuqinia indica TaxID=2692584 RepID=UPI00135C2B41|nr:hypothetical protein [Sunxiuqinia indica]
MEWIASHKEFITLLFSLIITISTVVYVILTRQLVKETRTLRKSQIQPFVSIFLKNPETKTNILHIFIENIGNGPAFNLTFKIIKDISYPKYCSPLHEHTHYKNGISYLPPNQTIDNYLVSEIGEKRIDDYVELEVKYSDILKNEYKSTFKLVFREAIWHGISEPPDTYEGHIGYYLKRIFKLYEKIENAKIKSDEK